MIIIGPAKEVLRIVLDDDLLVAKNEEALWEAVVGWTVHLTIRWDGVVWWRRSGFR